MYEAQIGFEPVIRELQSHALPLGYGTGDGADDEARTRYLHLGKVALYQMSYARIDPQLMLWIIPYGCAARYKRTDDAGGNRTGCKFPVHSLHMSVHDWVTNKLVPPVGIEPTTRGFSVRCSTN